MDRKCEALAYYISCMFNFIGPNFAADETEAQRGEVNKVGYVIINRQDFNFDLLYPMLWGDFRSQLCLLHNLPVISQGYVY